MGSGTTACRGPRRPLRPGWHVGLGYEANARLLTAGQREAGMAGRAPPMPERAQGEAAGLGSSRSQGDPPELDN